ncbi:MAG: ABC transporter substrate-binding protein, partial [Acidimicrobiia bacterium]
AGFVHQGQFRAPGGNSYQAAIIRDAGGDYVWSDNGDTTSLQLDIEEQVVRANDARFWLSTELNDWKTLDDVIAVDARLAGFAAVKEGQVWVNRLRVNEGGGNEFWERAPAYPHLWLADLVKILHPDLLPDPTLEWHLRVPARR